MKHEDSESPQLGMCIARMQKALKVDGHRLTNREICQRLRLSYTTYMEMKKGKQTKLYPYRDFLLLYLPALLEEANRHWLDELVRSLEADQKVRGL